MANGTRVLNRRNADNGDERTQSLSIEQIAQALHEDIIFGRLTPGTRLIEDPLMARFQCSRHFARQALYELERLGIVLREKNKGVSVRDLSLAEVRQIYEVRELLQRQAALRIPLPAPATLVTQLEQLHEAHLKAIREHDFSTLHEVNDAFHIAFFSACGNPFLVESIKHYMRLSLPVRATRTTDMTQAERSANEHYMLIQLLKGTDSWALAQLCVDHLQGAKNNYLHERGTPP